MPDVAKLREEAEAKGLHGDAERRYVGGVFNRIRQAHARATTPGKGAAHLNRKKRAEVKARISVRAHTYRGNSGFLISGKDTLGRKVSIFSRSKDEAERIRDAIKAGREPTFDSVKPAKPTPAPKLTKQQKINARFAPPPGVQLITPENVERIGRGHDAVTGSAMRDEALRYANRDFGPPKTRDGSVTPETRHARLYVWMQYGPGKTLNYIEQRPYYAELKRLTHMIHRRR